MAVDPYTPCPGGTGKKVKFCCPDLLGELDDIQRMLEGEQRLACLEHIDKLEVKCPDRACLLSMKAMLEAQLGREGKAEETLAHFMAKYPENPVALAEDATLKATKQGGKVAVEPLQKAIAASAGAMMPQVYDAISVVGERLVADGDYLAARGHLSLLMDLSGGRDERATALISNLDAAAQLPLLLKEAQPLMSAPEGALWKGTFDNATELIRKAQWLGAANVLRDLVAKAGGWPAIWRNIATLRLWLGETSAAIDALRKFARQPVGSAAAASFDEAVEAESLAQMIDAEGADYVDVLTFVYPVADFERVLAALSVDRHCSRLPFDLAKLATADQPPPRAGVWIVDPPAPASGEGILHDAVPRVVGQAFLFGKQTDREARLELVTYRTDEATTAQRVLAAIAGDAIGAPGPEKVTTRLAAVSHALSPNWQIPRDTPETEAPALLQGESRRLLLEVWPAIPLKLLGGKSAAEAAKDPAMQVPLAAVLLVLEFASMNAEIEGFSYNDLRAKLGLPIPTVIDPTGVDVLQLPLARLHRLDVAKLSDEQLEIAYSRAAHYRQLVAIRPLADEVLKRPSMEVQIPKQEVYGLLAQTESDPATAIGYVEKARNAAEAAGQSSAPWDITEMTLRMSSGDFQEADRLLHHIRNEHIREPGVAQALYQVLSEAGVIRPDGTPMPVPSQQAAASAMPSGAPAGDGGKIWTPGGDAAAAGKKSALWVPD